MGTLYYPFTHWTSARVFSFINAVFLFQRNYYFQYTHVRELWLRLLAIYALRMST